MPNYNFECEKCSHTFEEFLTISLMDAPLAAACPSCKKKGHMIRLIGASGRVDSGRLESTPGRLRPTSEFTEVMKRIKKNHPGSTMEVR
jgi:putative FmdB family regulatory protein